MANLSVDCHAHIIDLARFPVPAGRGYKPTAEERGTREEFCSTLDRHGLHHGLLVQLSGYGTDNSPILDAIAAYPGRFKAIAVIDASFDDRRLEDLARAGVVGVRILDIVGGGQGLAGLETTAQRCAELGWHVQIGLKGENYPALMHLIPERRHREFVAGLMERAKKETRR